MFRKLTRGILTEIDCIYDFLLQLLVSGNYKDEPITVDYSVFVVVILHYKVS